MCEWLEHSIRDGKSGTESHSRHNIPFVCITPMTIHIRLFHDSMVLPCKILRCEYYLLGHPKFAEISRISYRHMAHARISIIIVISLIF